MPDGWMRQLMLVLEIAKVVAPAILFLVLVRFVLSKLAMARRPDLQPAAREAFALDIKSRFLQLKWLLDGLDGLEGEPLDRAIAAASGQMAEHTRFLAESAGRIRALLSPRVRTVVSNYLARVEVVNRRHDDDLAALIAGEKAAVEAAIAALSRLTARQMIR